MNSDLVAAAAPCGGRSLVTVVEYLESSMSRDLLCKFPDNSSFDFDYSQSSIWSPLIHRPFPSTQISSSPKNLVCCNVSKRLVYDDGDRLTRIKRPSLKRKFTDAVLDHLHKYDNLKKRKMKKSHDFSPVTYSDGLSSTSPSRKRWTKVLKAASKHFKKMKKKKGSIAHINFTRCLTERDS